MTALLAALTLALAAVMLLWAIPHLLVFGEGDVRPLRFIWHSLREACLPERAGHTGGFRCASCGRTGGSLDDFPGHKGQGYVSPMRRTFTRGREHGQETKPWTDDEP